MPISGAPSASARRISAFVMNLDQHIHAEAPRFLDHGARCVVVQQGQHDENGVGTCDPGLDDLPPIDEEILGEDRPFEPLPGGCEIVERAAEVSGVESTLSASATPA